MKQIANGVPFRVWNHSGNEYWVQKVRFIEQFGLLLLIVGFGLYVVFQVATFQGLASPSGSSTFTKDQIRLDHIDVSKYRVDFRLYNQSATQAVVLVELRFENQVVRKVVMIEPNQTVRTSGLLAGVSMPYQIDKYKFVDSVVLKVQR